MSVTRAVCPRQEGVVSVARALDREARARYALQMVAQDRARAAWRCAARLRLALADVNDNAPAFSAPLYSATLPEDAEPGTLVAKVSEAPRRSLQPQRLAPATPLRRLKLSIDTA